MTAVAVGFACGLLLMLSACRAAPIEQTTLQWSTEIDLRGEATADKFKMLQEVCRVRGIDAYCLGDPFAGMAMSGLHAEVVTGNGTVQIMYTGKTANAYLVVELNRRAQYEIMRASGDTANPVKTIPSVGGPDLIYQSSGGLTSLVAPRGETVVTMQTETSPGAGLDSGVDEMVDAQAHLVALGR